MQPLTAQFKNYLVKQTRPKLSRATLKNYVSDVDQFLAWLAKDLQETLIQPIQLTGRVFQNYGLYLNAAQNHIHPATAERYLSSLRRFGEFLKTTGRTDSNPAADLKPTTIDPTLDQVLNDFRNELVRQNLSPSTIKNYVSDINHYLLWAKDHLKITGRDLLQLS